MSHEAGLRREADRCICGAEPGICAPLHNFEEKPALEIPGVGLEVLACALPVVEHVVRAQAFERALAAVTRPLKIGVKRNLHFDHAIDRVVLAAGGLQSGSHVRKQRLRLSPEEKMSVEDPVEMEKLADALPVERTEKRWIVSSDPDEHVAKIKTYIDLGFRHLAFHAPGPDQKRFLRLYGEKVLPRLRKF